MEITDFGLTPSHRLRLEAEQATTDQQNFIDHLKQLMPEEEKQIHHRLDAIVTQIQTSEANFQIKNLPFEQQQTFNEIVSSHPIESLHYFEIKSHTPDPKGSAAQEKTIQKRTRRFAERESEKLAERLDESINFHLVYLGALKQLYSTESIQTQDQTGKVIIQGVIGLIHERIISYESDRLHGHPPQFLSDSSRQSSLPAEQGRHISRKR